MIVVDASVLAPALADDGDAGSRARARLSEEDLVAPELIDLEVTSVLRGLSLARKLPASRALLALEDLAALPVERVRHRQLLARCWDLRQNVTVCDAAYVAVADLLDLRLVTADARLARAVEAICDVEVLDAGAG